MRKATISFVISVRPSVCLHGTTRLSLEGYSWNLIFECSLKICLENSSLIKVGQKWRVLYVHTNIHFLSYLAQFLSEWKMFRIRFVEKIETHILFSITSFRKSYRLWDNCEKILLNGTSHRWQYGACALRAGYLRLQTHTHNISYLLLIHCNNGCMKAPQCYVIRTLPVLLYVFPIPIKRTVLPSNAHGLYIPNRGFVKHFSLLFINYNVSNFQDACKFTIFL